MLKPFIARVSPSNLQSFVRNICAKNKPAVVPKPAFSRISRNEKPQDPEKRVLLLNEIADNPGALRVSARKGRGPAANKGNKSGRGQKGQNARSGGLHGRPWFQGGTTPLYKRFPRKAFKNTHPTGGKQILMPLNLDRLIRWIYDGRININETITLKSLKDSGVVKFKSGVKLLAGNPLPPKFQLPPISLQVTDCSDSARKLVEAAGGTVKLVYYNRVALRAHLHPERVNFVPRSNGLPPPRLFEKYGLGPKLDPDRVKEAEIYNWKNVVLPTTNSSSS